MDHFAHLCCDDVKYGTPVNAGLYLQATFDKAHFPMTLGFLAMNSQIETDILHTSLRIHQFPPLIATVLSLQQNCRTRNVHLLSYGYS